MYSNPVGYQHPSGFKLCWPHIPNEAVDLTEEEPRVSCQIEDISVASPDVDVIPEWSHQVTKVVTSERLVEEAVVSTPKGQQAISANLKMIERLVYDP